MAPTTVRSSRDDAEEHSSENSLPASPPLQTSDLDPISAETRRKDLLTGIFMAAVVAVFEMGPAIAKKGYGASDFEVALITSGHSLGLLLTFMTAYLAARFGNIRLVFWPELAARVCLAALFFVRPGFALAFVVLHAAAQMFQAMTIPARVTIYRTNYPSELRGRIVGRNRQVQMFVVTITAFIISASLEWTVGNQRVVALLGEAPMGVDWMLSLLFPTVAALGLVGSFIFRRIPLRPSADPSIAKSGAAPSLIGTARRFWTVWKRDRAFRRYEAFFLVFGFANILSIPLTQIHAVDALGADYVDMAVINVVLVQGVMALTMVFWGKLLDRHPPTRLRGILNLIFAVDFLAFALAPTLGWVFVGRIFRGFALGGGTLVWMLGSLHYARTPEEAPVYMGIHTVLTGVRWLTAPFVGVWLKDVFGQDARPVFFISFTVIVITAIWMIHDSRHDKVRHLDPPMPAPRTPGA